MATNTSSEFLRDLSNGGSPDLNVVASLASPVFFDFVAPRDTLFYSLNLTIACGPIRIDRFGDIAGGLANGLLVAALDPDLEVVFDAIGGEPIKANKNLSVVAGSGYNEQEDAGMGHIRADFNPPRPVLIPKGFRVRVTVRDALDSLDFFQIYISVDIG